MDEGTTETAVVDESAVGAAYVGSGEAAAPEEGSQQDGPGEAALPEGWRDSDEFRALVEERVQESLQQQMAGLAQQQQQQGAYDEYLASLDPFDESFGARVAELVQHLAGEQMRPLLEQQAQESGRTRVEQVMATFTDLSFDKSAAQRRAEEIFSAWRAQGAFQEHEQRHAAEQALRLAAEEVGRRRPTPQSRIPQGGPVDEVGVAIRHLARGRT
jgi:hypothetical protein